MSAHISSFVVLCRPQKLDEARAAIAALPGVEIHYCREHGNNGGKRAAFSGCLTRVNFYVIIVFMKTLDEIKQKRTELAVFLAPILAIAGIGGYGLFIWLSQMVS